jgi:hypothetical protein
MLANSEVNVNQAEATIACNLVHLSYRASGVYAVERGVDTGPRDHKKKERSKRPQNSLALGP